MKNFTEVNINTSKKYKIKIGSGLLYKIPGHTMGGVCFYFDDILVSGDTLFRGSVGRSDLATGNMSQLMDSLNNRLMKLPDETKVLPGHGPRSTIVFERENNPYIG